MCSGQRSAVRFRLSAFFCFLLFLLSVGRFSRMGWLRGLAVNEIVRGVTRPGVGLRWGFPAVFRHVMASAARFSRVFDTPRDALFCNDLHGVYGRSICVDRQGRVSLLLAAQHGGLASGDWGGLLVWWWFENSRAYLYYFFIVNDCQSVLRPARAFRVWVPGGRSNGTGFCGQSVFLINGCQFSYFLRVIYSMSFHEVFCGGFDSGSG